MRSLVLLVPLVLAGALGAVHLAAPYWSKSTCPACHGQGQMKVSPPEAPEGEGGPEGLPFLPAKEEPAGDSPGTVPCSWCQGSGKVAQSDVERITRSLRQPGGHKRLLPQMVREAERLSKQVRQQQEAMLKSVQRAMENSRSGPGSDEGWEDEPWGEAGGTAWDGEPEADPWGEADDGAWDGEPEADPWGEADDGAWDDEP